MALGRADRRDDAFADAGDDRLFRRAADELRQIGAHRHASTNLQLDAVLGDGAERATSCEFAGSGQSITLG